MTGDAGQVGWSYSPGEGRGSDPWTPPWENNSSWSLTWSGTTKVHPKDDFLACEQDAYLLGQPVDLELLFLLQHFLFLFVKLLLKLQLLLILSQLLQAVILGFLLIFSFLSGGGIVYMIKGYKVVLILEQHSKQHPDLRQHGATTPC